MMSGGIQPHMPLVVLEWLIDASIIDQLMFTSNLIVISVMSKSINHRK